MITVGEEEADDGVGGGWLDRTTSLQDHRTTSRATHGPAELDGFISRSHSRANDHKAPSVCDTESFLSFFLSFFLSSFFPFFLVATSVLAEGRRYANQSPFLSFGGRWRVCMRDARIAYKVGRFTISSHLSLVVLLLDRGICFANSLSHYSILYTLHDLIQNDVDQLTSRLYLGI